MAYSIDPKTSGEGIYRFLIGTAILECINDRHDEVRYATSLETATSMAGDLIKEHQGWWNAAMAECLLTDEGQAIYDTDGKVLMAHAEISKASRHKQLATLVILARKGGPLSRRRTGYDKKAQKFFEDQQVPTLEEEEEEEEGQE